MTVQIRPTSAPVGAIVTGLDVAGISRAEAADLYRAWLDHGVLIFKGLDLDAAGLLKLSEVFGEPEIHPIEAIHHKDNPLLVVLAANGGKPVEPGDPDADKLIGQIPWHMDQIYTDNPNRGALLQAVIIPQEGGNTGWIDTSRLYLTLPDSVKSKLQGLQIVHSYAKTHQSQNMVGGGDDLFPDVIHPLIYIHPETNLPVLNISPSTAKEIVGLPAEEGRALLDWLVAWATREEEAYVHVWEKGDLVLWDNLRTMHRAYGHLKRYPRLVQRSTLKSDMRPGRYVDGKQPKMQAA